MFWELLLSIKTSSLNFENTATTIKNKWEEKLRVNEECMSETTLLLCVWGTELFVGLIMSIVALFAMNIFIIFVAFCQWLGLNKRLEGMGCLTLEVYQDTMGGSTCGQGHYPLTLVAKSRPNLDPRPRGLPDWKLHWKFPLLIGTFYKVQHQNHKAHSEIIKPFQNLWSSPTHCKASYINDLVVDELQLS